jgi:hypothetical protein
MKKKPTSIIVILGLGMGGAACSGGADPSAAREDDGGAPSSVSDGREAPDGGAGGATAGHGAPSASGGTAGLAGASSGGRVGAGGTVLMGSAMGGAAGAAFVGSAGGGAGSSGGSAGSSGGSAGSSGGSAGSSGGSVGAAGSSSGSSSGSKAANSTSPLGSNLTQFRDYSEEYALVDAFKASRSWISGSTSGTWDDGRPIDVDADGWVRSLAPGQIARTLMFTGLSDYPGGRYTVLYDGEGTLTYGSDAKKNDALSAPGRDVLDVTPGGGIELDVVSLGSTPIKNIRVIMPGGACSNDSTKSCDPAGTNACGGSAQCVPFTSNYEKQIFHPDFLSRLKTYRVIRFMDWMDTNGSQQSTWSGRPKATDARYSEKGMPVEIMTALANRLHADPWFSMYHLADDQYVTEFAKYVHDNLDPTLHVYIEHSNEVWNGQFAQASYAENTGLSLGLSTLPYEAQVRYHSRRSVQIFDLFTKVFGDTSRLVRVMASQAGNAWTSDTELAFEDAAKKTDALAIAPYFASDLGLPENQARVDSMSVDSLAAELASVSLPTALQWVDDNRAVAEKYGVDLVAYEGGQSLVGVNGQEHDTTLNSLFDAMNRDPRMGQIYRSYLEGWKQRGGKLFIHYQNCSAYTLWGRWGSLESLRAPDTKAPKYKALQDFIQSQPAWW